MLSLVMTLPEVLPTFCGADYLFGFLGPEKNEGLSPLTFYCKRSIERLDRASLDR